MVDETSPYGETAFLSQWDDGAFGVWFWDQGLVQSAIEAESLRPDEWTVLPETAVQAPQMDGARLVQVLDGVEGQVWVAGALRASRFWSALPPDAEWSRFLRSSGVAGVGQTSLPTPMSVDWLDRAWPRNAPTRSLTSEIRGWPAVAAVCGILIAPFAFQLGEFFSLRADRLDLNDRIRELSVKAAPVLAARDVANKNQTRIRQLLALNPYPSQLDIMARVTEKLPTNGVQFNDWIYQQGELRFTLTGQPFYDSTFYVRAISSIPHFTDVNADTAPGPGLFAMRMKIAKVAP